MMKIRFSPVISFVFVAILISGCDKSNDPSMASREAKLAETIEGQSTQIRLLRKDLLDLKLKVAGLENQSATVTSDSPAYSIVKTRHGPFTVALIGLTPYLDGYKAKLRIGNMTTATFNGVNLNASWGPLMTAGVDEYLGKRKEKRFDLTTAIRPQAFTEVEVALSPAKADEVKEIDLSLEFNSISLRRQE